jgi:hypothetical protein
LAAAFLRLLAAGAYALSTQAPEAQPQPQPASGSPTAKQAPYPAQAAHITFTRLRIGDRAKRTFTVELRATATSPLTVLRVGQNYEAVDLRLAGHAPAAVRPGHPRTLVLHGGVTNCDGVPLRARSPFLDVTLRNERARQKQSVIPGERYTRALTHAFRTLCGPSRTASTPNP